MLRWPMHDWTSVLNNKQDETWGLWRGQLSRELKHMVPTENKAEGKLCFLLCARKGKNKCGWFCGKCWTRHGRVSIKSFSFVPGGGDSTVCMWDIISGSLPDTCEAGARFARNNVVELQSSISDSFYGQGNKKGWVLLKPVGLYGIHVLLHGGGLFWRKASRSAATMNSHALFKTSQEWQLREERVFALAESEDREERQSRNEVSLWLALGE